MLQSFTTDTEYLAHLNFAYASLDSSSKERLKSPLLSSALKKLRRFRLDDANELISSAYSSTGRPALLQAELFRSFFLMLHLKETSVKNWAAILASDPLLLYLIGCTSSPPSASSHYDFINRFALDSYINELFPASKNRKSKPKIKPKKGEKLDNLQPLQVESLVDHYLTVGAPSERSRSSFLLQSLFNQLAVIPSQDFGLIDSHNLTLSGDGTAFHLHASAFGKQVEDETLFTLTHRYSAPNADCGWDSDLGVFYFGYTFYNISYYSPLHKCDLPCFITIDKASVHDALTSISAFAQFLDINPELRPKYYCLDSASDNYPTHDFLYNHHNVIPIIDINKRRIKKLYASFENLNDQGIPVCDNNIPMIYNGYEHAKRRNKFRCPLAMGKIDSCPHEATCRKSEYGRVRYTKLEDDPKLFGPVPYQSKKWKDIYKNRTSTERINTRLLNDYHLHDFYTRSDKKLLFFAIFAGINIHLDAQVKAFD